jgi:hypothetical protein
MEDVAGAGKTILAHTLAGSLDSPFQRTQFTSAMLPSDVQALAFVGVPEEIPRSLTALI